MANFNLNKVIIGGRLTADPELKQTQSGISVCSFKIAVNRKTQNNEQDSADFFSCTAWRTTAETVSRYFRKGSSICVIGSINNRTYTANDGQKRTVTEINADDIAFVDSKSESNQTPLPQTPTFSPKDISSKDGGQFGAESFERFFGA